MVTVYLRLDPRSFRMSLATSPGPAGRGSVSPAPQEGHSLLPLASLPCHLSPLRVCFCFTQKINGFCLKIG